MKRRRAALILTVVALTLGLAACRGETDPASQITSSSARLNAHGSSDNGPAYSYFEYWKTATPAAKSTTPTRNWGANATAPFSEDVTGLSASASYSFRVCGNDAGKAAACMATRSFTTLAPPATARSTASVSGGVLTFTSAVGRRNLLELERRVFADTARDEIRLTEREDLDDPLGGSLVDAGAGCLPVSGSVRAVRCGAAGITRVVVKLGDLEDSASWEPSAAYVNTRMEGGSGDDTLVGGALNDVLIGGSGADWLQGLDGTDTLDAADGEGDALLSCGGGTDTATVDSSDADVPGGYGFDCETVFIR